MAPLTTEQARYWLARWDRQQTTYIPERERRFDVIVDVVESAVDRPDPLVVDLGVGPASLSGRLLERLPEAHVVGVDADPLLLALAAAAYEGRNLRVVRADLREDGWFDTLGLDRVPDAYVSTTALHWLNRAPLARMLQVCAQNISATGVFVNGDHLYEAEPRTRMDHLSQAIADVHARRVGTADGQDWAQWWDAVEQAPELADLVEERAGGFDHTITERATVATWIEDLRAAGFSEAGQVWQYGDDRVVVGLR